VSTTYDEDEERGGTPFRHYVEGYLTPKMEQLCMVTVNDIPAVGKTATNPMPSTKATTNLHDTSKASAKP
jgi:hypothetical protein